MDILNWLKVNPVYCSAEKIDQVITELEEDKRTAELKNAEKLFARREAFFSGTWSRIITESKTEIRVFRYGDMPKRFMWLKDKVVNHGDSIENEHAGLEAFTYVEDLYKKHIGQKKSLFSTFSGNKYKKEYFDIKGCVPTQVQYLNNRIAGRIISGCTKADVSSAFPTQMTKPLPTLHDCKRVKGRAEPDKDFPFAFYIKSHHIKTLDGINTQWFRNEFYLKYYYKIYDDTINPEDDETILCHEMPKAEHDALAAAFKDLYEHRKDDPDLKFYMNVSIGFCHLNSNPRLSFIPAIVIARCNSEMFDRAYELQKRKKKVLFIATDSIAWQGGEDKIATDEKYLGSFTYEGKNIKFLGYSPKAYQWETPEGKVTTKYSGMKKEESAKLKFGELKNVYKGDLECSYYVRDMKTGHMERTA